jgi:predicted amidohydrolase
MARVGLAQIRPRLGDLDANVSLHHEIVDRAIDEGLDYVVFPELSLTGYFVKDMVAELARPLAAEPIATLAARSREIGIVAGFIEDGPGHRIYNAAAVMEGGRVVHVHRKIYLPTYGLFDEMRYFAPGDRVRSFDCGLGRAGVLVCEDLWHLSNAWLLWLGGIDLLLGLSSSPARGVGPEATFETSRAWEHLNLFYARFLGIYTLYVNRVGVEDGVTFGGGTQAVDPSGRLLFRAGWEEEGLFDVTIDPEEIRRARLTNPLLRDERPDLVLRELRRLRDVDAELEY